MFFFSQFPNSFVRKQRTLLIGIVETHLYGQERTTSCKKGLSFNFLEFKTWKCVAFCILPVLLLSARDNLEEKSVKEIHI
ncbi:hypothetical protein XENTR_v10011140 [Xenopus tropicalis]|nr:hypothetical protein XENTR_v10011140 [Xenopus tropicalis]